MADSPQAQLPTKRSNRQLAEALVYPSLGSGVAGPNLITANGVALLKQSKTLFRQIQNCGTVPVKYLVDNDNLATDLNFHGILAACTAVDDGLGSIIDFSKVTDRVSIIGVGGTARVCTFIGTTSESQ